MLCDLARCARISQFASAGNVVDDDDDRSLSALLCHLAHSLIPLEFHDGLQEEEDDDDDNDDDDDDDRKISSKSSSSTLHLHGSNDRISTIPNIDAATVPTKRKLRRFSSWFFHFINDAGIRRRDALRRNVARGAVFSAAVVGMGRATRRGGKLRRDGGRGSSSAGDEYFVSRGRSASMKGGGGNGWSGVGDGAEERALLGTRCQGVDNRRQNAWSECDAAFADRLIRTLACLSPQYDEDPQLYEGGNVEGGGALDAIDVVERIGRHEKNLLFLIMLRYVGVFSRVSVNQSSLKLERSSS
jgi:hypothetical protein